MHMYLGYVQKKYSYVRLKHVHMYLGYVQKKYSYVRLKRAHVSRVCTKEV